MSLNPVAAQSVSSRAAIIWLGAYQRRRYQQRGTTVSMILAAAHDTYGAVLAQLGNPTPEAPPLADKILQMVRYFTWFILLAGITAITYAGGRFAWEKWSGGG